MKNLNKIHRNEYVSAEYMEVHMSNNIEYRADRKSRRGDILSNFHIMYGVNKNEHDDFNLLDKVCINRRRILIDLASCYSEE